VKISAATGAGSIIMSIFVIVFMIVFMGIAYGMTSFMGDFGDDGFGPSSTLITLISVIFMGIPGLVIIGMVFRIITGPKRAEKARQEQRRFLNSLDRVPDGIREAYPDESMTSDQNYEWSSADITCLQCGNQLDLSDLFCPKCGDSTADEKKYYR
jgi:hypothetical protein